MRVAIAGTGRIAVKLFKALSSSSHEVVSVVQNGRRVQGVQRVIRPAVARLFRSGTMIGLAKRHGLPIIWIDTMDDAELAPLREIAPDLLLVGGFSIILKEPLLSLPKVGCMNVHSSLLPRHRGPNPFCGAIASGDAETGVTFHCMEGGIDTGDIVAQFSFPLDAQDTMMSVFRRASDLAGKHVEDVLDTIARDGLVGAPQDEALAMYEKKLTGDDVWVRWEDSAESIDRLVRACAPAPMPRFLHRGHVVSIARTHFDPTPVDEAPGTVLQNHGYAIIATGEGRLFTDVAYAKAPVPWIWPAPWLRPAVGERLESRVIYDVKNGEHNES